MQEVILYCLILLAKQGDQKRWKEIDSNLDELIGRIRVGKNYFRYARSLLFLNLVNHVQYQRGLEPLKDYQKAILIGSTDFGQRKEFVMFKFLCPLLMQQYSRYFLMNRIKCPRTFFYYTTQTASLYIKKANLVGFGRAAYITACKWYDQEKVQSWGLINEHCFYALGELYMVEGTENNPVKAVEYFSKALNNYHESKLSKYDIPNKSLANIMFKLIHPEHTKNEETIKTCETYLEKNLKILSIKGFNILTNEEIVKRLDDEEVPESNSDVLNPFVIKDNIEKLLNILKSKLSEKEYMEITKKIKFITIPSVKERVEKCSAPREVSMNEPVLFKISLENHFYVLRVYLEQLQRGA